MWNLSAWDLCKLSQFLCSHWDKEQNWVWIHLMCDWEFPVSLKSSLFVVPAVILGQDKPVSFSYFKLCSVQKVLYWHGNRHSHCHCTPPPHTHTHCPQYRSTIITCTPPCLLPLLIPSSTINTAQGRGRGELSLSASQKHPVKLSERHFKLRVDQ